jgi:glutamate-1-semialdehyde 2,1-aminomutase
MNIEKSKRLFEEAQKFIPGGVNSPVRAFKSVGGDPLFISRGRGSKMVDADGNEYIDYIGSWGPHFFGHNPDFIKEALLEQIENGVSFGAPTEIEIKMAQLITELVPSVELVRMVNSGTEATMSAIRAARGFTGKDKFIKFEGCYHGHADYFLIKAGSGALTLGIPTSPGVTQGNARDTLTADFNDIDSVKKVVAANKDEIAAIILEPIAGNMGVIPAKEEFLTELRDICTRENIVLIFDEVMTGFRVAPGGAQELLAVKPDLTTFGKIIGGGLPVGAGYAALKKIKDNPYIYTILEEQSAYLEKGMKENLMRLGKEFTMTRVGSMMCMFFTEAEVIDFKSAVKSNTALYGKYFNEMLRNGVYLAPAQFEAMFVSAAHTKEDLDKTIEAHYNSLKSLL